MSTTNVTSTKKATKKKQWRPSKQEVLEGFITQVASPAEIAAEITRKREKAYGNGPSNATFCNCGCVTE